MKKLITLFAVAALGFALVGCGRKTDDSTTGTTATSAAPAATAGTTAGATAAPAAADTTTK